MSTAPEFCTDFQVTNWDVNVDYFEDDQGMIHLNMTTPEIKKNDTVTWNSVSGAQLVVEFKTSSPFLDGKNKFKNGEKSDGCSGQTGQYAYTLTIGRVIFDPVIIVK